MEHRVKRSVLFYWQDVWLPHSRFVLDAFVSETRISEFIAAGPAKRAKVPPIFAVTGEAQMREPKWQEEKVRCYRWRETMCTFREWRRMIRRYQPEIVVVVDEALSVNVLLAGLANRLYGHGKVLFYAFENIVQGIGWRAFIREPNLKNLMGILRKSLRFVVLDRFVMIVRRRVVHGGLASYDECIKVVRAMRWRPPMSVQWWPVNEQVFTAYGPKADFGFIDKFVIGFVGRFVVEKGIQFLVSAMTELDDEYVLVLIGDGPQKSGVEREIQSLGLSNRVRVMSPQSAEALAKSYRAMNILVLPSIPTDTWKEQYGRVLVEARCCGAMVAGSDSGAIPTVVGNPDFIFPAGDSKGLAAIVRRAAGLQQDRPSPMRRPNASEFVNAWLLLDRELRGELRECGDARAI